MANMVKQYGWWVAGALVVLGGIGWFGWKVATAPTIPEEDIVSRQGIHWHPALEIRVKGERVEIPAGVGLGARHADIHTHEVNDRLHYEMNRPVRRQDLRLGRFFEIWGKRFDSQCILEDCNGSDGTVKMLVNGQPNSEFENYLVRDGDVVEITFE